MPSNPSIVVFDIGNVLVRWEMRTVYRDMFENEELMEAFIDETSLMAWNLEQDRGRSWKEAEDLLIAQFPQHKDAILAFRARWHDMIGGLIEGTVQIKERLKEQGVPLYAITNFASDTFAESQERFPTLKDFIDIVISAEEELVKPDPSIYQVLLKRNGLKAEDCIFIDDSLPNVEAARSVGMHAHHFSCPDALAEDLRSKGFDL